MLPHLFIAPREISGRDDGAMKARAGHRLAGGSGGGDSPRAAARLAPSLPPAACLASSGSPHSPRKASVLPSYRVLLGGTRPGRQLPHVHPGCEASPASTYTSLDGLTKLGMWLHDPATRCTHQASAEPSRLFSMLLPGVAASPPHFDPASSPPLHPAELHKGKHSTVQSYLDARTGRLLAVKTYHKRTMAKRHFRNVRREVDISRMLARQR